MCFKVIFWGLIKKLSDLGFSIFLFLLIAFISLLGTIIEQNQSIDYYKLNYPENKSVLFILNWRNIDFWGLDHLYTNRWFFCLILLFFFSLMSCTFSTQLPILKQARRWKFISNHLAIEKKNNYNFFLKISLLNSIYLLNLKKYYIFHKGKSIYAYKGLLGKVSPIFVHLAIIIALVGPFIGSFAGFLVQEFVVVGEISHTQNIIKAGNWSNLHSNLLYKVDDFCVTYNSDKSIKQFFSKLSILNNNGQFIYSKYISVNHPLKFKGLTFYQTDWQMNTIRIQLSNSYFIEKSLTKIANDINNQMFWFCTLYFDQHEIIYIAIPDLQDNILLYNGEGNLIQQTHYGIWNIIYGTPVIINELVPLVGLQIKSDPGISITYLGLCFLMFSIVFSYTSYAQVWFVVQSGKLYTASYTNRAFLLLENEWIKIYNKYIALFFVV